MFIFISGFTMAQLMKKEINWIRILKFSSIAAMITLITMFFVPEEFVSFGIMHFFAISSILAIFFVERERMSLILGITFIVIGFYLQQFRFPFEFLFWLGLIPKNFVTLDYYPLLPWFGVMLLGIYAGRKVRLNRSKYRGGIICYLGRNSLAIYLVQHPVIILILHAYYGDILQHFIK